MSGAVQMRWTALLLMLSLCVANQLQAQEILRDREKLPLDSTEGWAMAHTTAASLNLGSAPLASSLAPWQFAFSAELGSIPRLSRQEQRVGFGGFKFEDMNKSPVFGRGRVHMGLPAGFTAELSWTPPLEINGAQPQDVFGLALERPILAVGRWQLGARAFLLRGDGTGDITCSGDVVANEPGSAGNPFGCRERSDDSSALDHQGLELLLSRSLGDGRWQPFLGLAHTRIDAEARVDAQVFEVIDRSVLTARGEIVTATLGLSWQPLPNWQLSTAYSYTPLDVRRPPLRETDDGDFWSLRLGLRWQPDGFGR